MPHFAYHSPRTVREAAELLAAPGGAMLVAGGTDLLPNMKRRQQVPSQLIGLRRVAELRTIANGTGLTIGAGVTLTELVRDVRVRDAYGALWQAASQVATPHLRNMATLGGNLCLDTRCNYYDQNYEWRKAIDFCMKKDGKICWVATGSPKCLAVSSTDTAPALLALGASVTLVSADGTRQVAASDLYQHDGIHYLTRRPDEILTAVHIPPMDGWRSVYWKLRRRGSFDFPVLSVAAAAKFADDGTVEAARIILGAVASRPIDASAAATAIIGQRLTDDVIAHAAERAAQPAKPMDNTDFDLTWRKRVMKDVVTYALRELRGDDVREWRRKISKQML
ncbi:MAG TPA: xanthine dehydrogenase family protein subunit M [Vicinamibacterales bacterium]|nr:xanthine dehydrogenase family protein subunit M [Vicinamibacterales bacterium]